MSPLPCPHRHRLVPQSVSSRLEVVVVNTPPGPHERPGDELDPTGIRHLLSSLPDPGPMPADLVDRINASIAREESARGVRPVVVPLRRRSVWPKVAVAAAAVAVVGVGVPALFGGGGNPVTTAFSESASEDSAGGSAAAGCAAPTEPRPTLSDPVTTAQPDTRSARRDGVVSLLVSGTAYTSAGLVVQAQRVVAGSGAPSHGHDALTSGAPATTDHGLRDCLHGLGVEDWQPVTGDVATFDGQQAVVAVVDSDTGQTVWVVPPDCTASSPRALAGPVPLG